MPRWSDGLGRTIVIAAIAGTLFAGFLALTPRLTASTVDTVPTTTTVASAPESALPGIADPVVAVPVAPVDVQVTVTTEPPVSESPDPSVQVDPSTTTTTIADPGFDGSIRLTVEARNAADAHAGGVFVEGDEIQWRFTVENVSDEELWGTYVYLELHGPAWCDEHNLQAGESTDCWIATTAVEGHHTAEAWATAWTIDRLVKDRIEYTFQVTL